MMGAALSAGAPMLAIPLELILSNATFPAAATDQIQRWSLVATIVSGINVLLLIGLLTVWGRNYLDFRSKHTLGLAVFALLLLLRNCWALYIYQFDPILAAWFASDVVPPGAWGAMLLLHVLETAALMFLVWVTWD